jgi:prepilin-type N-terminal cleavage/methylation domain-containing protein/prepilin-type processing-associated H-X9-DG protein
VAWSPEVTTLFLHAVHRSREKLFLSVLATGYDLCVPEVVLRRRAFTLVELLVVIGVIAVMIGILLPALSHARAQARQLKCLNNIRQIGMASTMYTGEFKGWMLPGYWGWSQATGGWPTTTPPAIPASGPRRYWFQVFTVTQLLNSSNSDTAHYPLQLICPEASLALSKGNGVTGYDLHESYGINYTQLPGLNVNIAPNYWNAWQNVQIRSSAEKIYFVDSTSEGVSVTSSATNSTLRYFDPYYGGELHEPPDKGSAIAYRHYDGANALYYDGHAQWRSEAQLRYLSTDTTTKQNLRQWQPTTE